MSIETKLLHQIRKHRLFDSEDKLLLAVSGGMDSVLMLTLLKEMNYSVHVAHCNFGLRGEESDADANFVEELCRSLQVPCFITKFDTSLHAEKHLLSIQMSARELRYTWFSSLCNKHGFSTICTAHHADDHTETILLNLIKGKGLSALSGIPVRNGNIVRPLLSFSKEELKLEAERRHLQWREDSSNATIDYQRNFLRHEIIPKLLEINPSLNNSMQRLSAIAAETAQLSEEHLIQLLSGCTEESDDRFILHVETIRTHPSLNSILHRYLFDFNFHPSTVNKIADALRTSESGKTFSSGSWKAVTTGNQLIVERNENEIIYSEALTIESPEGEVLYGDRHVLIEHLDINTLPDLSSQKNNIAFLDAAKISYPLILRPWKAGDIFQPLGMDHRQKVSDFLINNKVSLPDKEKCLVLQSGDDIVWLIGYRIDQRYRLTENTKQVLRITVRAHENTL